LSLPGAERETVAAEKNEPKKSTVELPLGPGDRDGPPQRSMAPRAAVHDSAPGRGASRSSSCQTVLLRGGLVGRACSARAGADAVLRGVGSRRHVTEAA